MLRSSKVLLPAVRKLEQELPVDKRLAQVVEFFDGMNGDQLIEGYGQIVVEAFEMDRLSEAETYAKKLLAAKKPSTNPVFVSSANGMVDLVALSKNDRVSARKYLALSAEAILPAAGPKETPRLMLAEKKLEAGELEPVASYLKTLFNGNWYPYWSKKLIFFQTELQANRLKSFRPSPRMF